MCSADNDTQRDSRNSRAAIEFAQCGVPVFPCIAEGARTKSPLTARGHHDATNDIAKVRQWWGRWPGALIGVPTGTESGVWVLDVDGEVGRQSLNALICWLQLDGIADLTPCISQTPRGGLHLIFALLEGERPRSRVSDLGPGLDTRGVKIDGTSGGCFIAPGSHLPDGRRYEFVDPSSLGPFSANPRFAFENASPAPRELLLAATFRGDERRVIQTCPRLRRALLDCQPERWQQVYTEHTTAHSARQAQVSAQPNVAAMRRQALHDLSAAADTLAALRDERRASLFRLSARLARYVSNAVLTADEVRSTFTAACVANGSIAAYGYGWANSCINRALYLGRSDPLPPLARRFDAGGST